MNKIKATVIGSLVAATVFTGAGVAAAEPQDGRDYLLQLQQFDQRKIEAQEWLWAENDPGKYFMYLMCCAIANTN